MTTSDLSTTGVAHSVDPMLIHGAIRDAGITDVITVPDTHQKSLLDVLARSGEPRLITVCTEDEAMGVNLGLYLGGRRPMLLIQNSGFYAAVNTIRGLVLDAEVPAVLLIGEFARDPARPPEAHDYRLVRLLQPTLRTWDIPYYRLDSDDDVGNISIAVTRAWADRGPIAILVGARTAELRETRP